MSFWRDLPQPFFILAPMEAVTDVVFRHVVEKAGAPDLYFSEFTNATGWVHAGEKAIGGRLVKTKDETSLVAQLWGAIPDDIAKLAAHCKDLGFKGIDINMGCPDASAVKAGGGAGMIRTPDVACQMIEAARSSGLPISVKTRLGYSRVDEWQDWLRVLLEQNIENLTIHLRTKKEMSKVPAHFELIPEIVALRDKVAPNTLLTINGDIEDREQGLKIAAEHPGVNGIMIGRGIFHNPYAFEHEPKLHTKEELLGLLKTQLDLYDQYSDLTKRPFDTLKRFFKIYVNSFEGAAELRDKLMHTKSTDEVRAILSE
ncbi:MAG TPA: tRNA-dihydrouridine synthase [Candidatus Saccharimonadales bacterium]